MQKLRLGVVGLGFGVHVINHQVIGNGGAAPYVELAAVCRRDRAKCDAVAARYGVRAYYGIDDLLADPAIDVVGLFTDPVGRADQIRRIIQAGKHVMTTKPLERDADAALAVLREAQELGRVVHLNSPCPVLTVELRQIRQWQQQYELGRAVGARVETWCSYREQADGGWYDDPTKCPAAPIFRLGVYAINDLVPFLGQAESAQVAHSRIFTGRPTPDNALATIRFRNGAIAGVSASFCVEDGQAYRQTLTLNFERGTVRRSSSVADDDNQDVELTLMRRSAWSRDRADCEAKRYNILACSGRYQWDVFYKAVQGEQFADALTPEELVAGIRIVDAIGKAEQSGRTELVEG